MLSLRSIRYVGLISSIVLLLGCQHPSQSSSPPPWVATRLQLAWIYLGQEDLASAKVNLDKLAVWADQDINIDLAKAHYDVLNQQPERAEMRYQRLLAKMPDNLVLLNNYGAFLCGLGQYKTAQSLLDRAVSLSRTRNSDEIRLLSIQQREKCRPHESMLR